MGWAGGQSAGRSGTTQQPPNYFVTGASGYATPPQAMQQPPRPPVQQQPQQPHQQQAGQQQQQQQAGKDPFADLAGLF